MKKLLWVGDAACPSGFARATHETLEWVRREYDVTVLGINYRGDPHDYPYPIYAAFGGGDAFGVGRIIWMCDLVKPDVIVLQNDPWNVPSYMRQLAHFPEYKDIPVVASIAIDGKNCAAKELNGLAKAVFWTQFALGEARQGGYIGPAEVIPLGVDLLQYQPMDQREARKNRNLPEEVWNSFIVGNVNRNQPRKRWDLTIRYFAEWVKSYKVKDAFLYLHVAPTGDIGVNVQQLASYYGVQKQLAMMEPAVFYGIAEDQMRDTYCSFDVYASTTQGEGMGLPAMEAMACGVPCVLPDWAAYGDWAKDAALLVPCTSTAVGPPYNGVIGGVVDEGQYIAALDKLYRDKSARLAYGAAGARRVREDRFRWENIGQAWLEMLREVLA